MDKTDLLEGLKTSIEKMNTIDLSGVAPGIYSLKLSGDEIVINKCLIKQ